MTALRRFLAAWRFLTVIPAPGSAGTAEEDFRPAVFWFAPVGGVVGAGLWGVACALAAAADALGADAFAARVAPVLLVALMAAVSGGFHLDGLADTFDGLASARGRERALEIMRDSRIGTMGALALGFVLLLKIAALGCVPAGRMGWAVAGAMVGGRCALMIMVAWLPYVREKGLGSVWARWRGHAGLAVWAVLALAAPLVALGGPREAWRLVPWAATVGLAGWWFLRRLGGATGDTYGAAAELAETALLLSFAAMPPAWAAWYQGAGLS